MPKAASSAVREDNALRLRIPTKAEEKRSARQETVEDIDLKLKLKVGPPI